LTASLRFLSITSGLEWRSIIVQDPSVRKAPSGAGVDGAPDAMARRIDELSDALAARDAFLAVAAHELRNPMTPILAQVQRLRRLSTMPDTQEAVSAGLDRLEGLVEHYIRRATVLLDVSRMTTGKLRLIPETFDLAELARHIVDAQTPSAQYVETVLSLDVSASVTCHLDRLAVEQVMDNLISNAIKYGAGQPVRVAVRPDGAHAELTVQDQGIGISEDDQGRIFGRFERAVGSGSRAGGLGVGLWVVGQLVDAMGGSIMIDSRPGDGATFTVRLPLAAPRPNDKDDTR
jgi:signal transduction histidine kinase